MVELIGTWPKTKVTMTWGSPHFRVEDKIFSGWGAGKDGRYATSAKLDKDKQAALVASDPRFEVAAYVGKHGWVTFTPGDKPNLGELEALLLESYRNVAPKKLVEQLDSAAPVKAKTPAKATVKKATPKALAPAPAKAKKADKAKPTAKAAAARGAAVKATSTGRAAAGGTAAKRAAVKASSSTRAAPKAAPKAKNDAKSAKPKR